MQNNYNYSSIRSTRRQASLPTRRCKVWIRKPLRITDKLPSELLHHILSVCPSADCFHGLITSCKAFGCFSREMQPDAKIRYAKTLVTTTNVPEQVCQPPTGGIYLVDAHTVTRHTPTLPNGAKHGIEVESAPSYDNEIHRLFVDGVQQGNQDEYTAGVLRCQEQYLDGRLHGACRYYRKTGMLSYYAIYTHGSKAFEEYYSKNATIRCTIVFQGATVKKRHYTRKGALKQRAVETGNQYKRVHYSTGSDGVLRKCKMVRGYFIDKEEEHDGVMMENTWCSDCGELEKAWVRKDGHGVLTESRMCICMAELHDGDEEVLE